MKIRKYIDKDWKFITDIFNRAKPDELKGSVDKKDIVSLEKDEVLLNSFRKSNIFVMEDYDNVIGYVGNQNNLITFLFVDPDYYGNGFGTMLLNHILPLIGEKTWLIVAKSNISAVNLYDKFGFSIVEEFIGKYNGKVDIPVLRLALKPELESWKS